MWCGEKAVPLFQKILGILFLEMQLVQFIIRSNRYLWPLAHWGRAFPPVPLKYALARVLKPLP